MEYGSVIMAPIKIWGLSRIRRMTTQSHCGTFFGLIRKDLSSPTVGLFRSDPEGFVLSHCGTFLGTAICPEIDYFSIPHPLPDHQGDGETESLHFGVIILIDTGRRALGPDGISCHQ